jgi:hypothetical protein
MEKKDAFETNTMKRELTSKEIETLAMSQGARRNAVENFLETLPKHTNRSQDLANLAMDAKLYGWKLYTVDAIMRGINLAHKG